jgi:hypothetical protein
VSGKNVQLQELFRKFYEASRGRISTKPVGCEDRLIDYLSTHYSRFVFEEPDIRGAVLECKRGKDATILYRFGHWAAWGRVP